MFGDASDAAVAPSSVNEKTFAVKSYDEGCFMGDTGLEPVTPSLSSWCSSQLS
jgi:hypothetical protein